MTRWTEYDLEIHRLRAVHHDLVLGLLVGDVDSIGVSLDEVDGGRAVEREAGLVHERPQLGVRSRERDDHVDLVPRVASQRLPEPEQLHEPEALGKREVLVEQTEPAEGAPGVGDQRLVAVEPHRLDCLASQPLEPGNRPGGRCHENAEAAADDQLVELQGDLVPSS